MLVKLKTPCKVEDVLYGARIGMYTETSPRMKSFVDLGGNLSIRDILGCEEIIFKLSAAGETSYLGLYHDYNRLAPSGCYIFYIATNIKRILGSTLCSYLKNTVVENDLGECYEKTKYILQTDSGEFDIVYDSYNIDGFFPKTVVKFYTPEEFKNRKISIMGIDDEEIFIRHI